MHTNTQFSTYMKLLSTVNQHKNRIDAKEQTDYQVGREKQNEKREKRTKKPVKQQRLKQTQTFSTHQFRSK